MLLVKCWIIGCVGFSELGDAPTIPVILRRIWTSLYTFYLFTRLDILARPLPRRHGYLTDR